jgi:hypothetical protein
MRAGLAGQRLYAAGVADDDPRKQANDERLDRLAASIAPKRAARIRRPVDGKPALPLEKHVLAEVLQALRRDLRVALIDRRQSGAFMEGDRWITVGTPGTLDISGMLVGGRYFEIECKRPGQKPDERQALRIARIVKGGGISGYATSAEEAIALLP